ncbi:carbon-nitrogen hydrolase [Coemansia mojavensis]|nr:carbon-nitrogen hydrolase [Coemansia mojavensis]KAJ1739857.1 Carbon-nitrogen hydrolase [Coemansia sp. RSA 1086]
MADHIAHSEVEAYDSDLKGGDQKHDALEEHEYDLVEHHDAGNEEYAGEYGEYEMGDVEMDQNGQAAEEYDAENVVATDAGSILATQENGEHQLMEDDGEQQQAEEYYEHKDGDEIVDENDQVLAHQEQHGQEIYDEQTSHMYDQEHVDAGSMDYSMIESDAAGNSSLDALSQVISSSVGHLRSEMDRNAHANSGAAHDSADGSNQEQHDSAQGKDHDSSYGLSGHSPSPAAASSMYKARMGGSALSHTQNVTPAKRSHSSHSGEGSSNNRLKSKVWNWYDILPDGHRQCRFCPQKYGRLTATTILARHYHNRHDANSPSAMTPTAHRTSHHRQHQIKQGHGASNASMTHIAISQAGPTIYSQAAAAAAVAAASAAANRTGSPDGSSHLFHSQTNGESAYAQSTLTNGTPEEILRSVSEAVQQHGQGQYENNQLIIQDGFAPMLTSPLSGISLSSARRAFAAVGQFCAQSDINKNLQTCLQLIGGAARRGARMVFLPEASDFIADSRTQSAQLAQGLDGEFMKEIQQAAKDNNIWVSLGVHEQPSVSGMPYNTNAVVSDDGSLVSAYRKLHMFDVNVKDGPRLLESASTSRGERMADVVDTPVGKLGLSVCYDLRFPEMAQALRQRGSQLLCYPSAFTEPTGAAHWEVLLRARAVETQTYVFAAAQIGRHNTKRSSYGDAMVVDPWGTVVARCSRNSLEPALAIAEINLDYLDKIRREMPVFDHKRPDIFGDYST